ncbi:MAG: response regulator [Planctomycetes bacterium]|nr:response regulator [Planctomycetota bacterium]
MKKLMVVDDEAIITMQLEDRLRSMEYDVVGTASSAGESVCLARERRPDLILMDIVLSGTLDGIDAAGIIKAELGIPVIFLTGYADEKYILKAKKLEPSGFLLKPFRINEIRANIEFALHRKESEQKRAAEQLRTLSQAIEQSPVAVIITDRSGIIEYVNPRFTQITEYTKEESIGQDFCILQSDKVLPDVNKELWRAIQSGSEWRGEFCNKKKSGEPYWEATAISPVKNPEGTITHFITIKEDITERRKINSKLQKIQKLESLGGIAHNFNNVLAGILGHVALAKMKTGKEDNAYRNLLEAEKIALNARDLAKQFLIFSSGGEPVMKTSSIKKVINETTKFSQRGSNVKHTSFLPEDLWQVKIDEGQMRQAINNLVINARQAMPEGGMVYMGAENISLGNREIHTLKAGDYVRIKITDQGPGILDKHLEKIFDPFFTARGKGSGLGLSICYAIIRKHGGYISAKSNKEAGTTFTIYIPASLSETQAEDGMDTGLLSGSGKVLLMDDNYPIRETTRGLIKKMGYDVATAREGSETIMLYKKAKESGEPFDVVILDLTTPNGMGGVETINNLLKIDPGVKAIVSSGYYNDPIMTDFKEHGFCNVIPKPYREQDLSSILHDVITKAE